MLLDLGLREPRDNHMLEFGSELSSTSEGIQISPVRVCFWSKDFSLDHSVDRINYLQLMVPVSGISSLIIFASWLYRSDYLLAYS